MTFDEFNATLQLAGPPEVLSPPLRALWQDAKGDWRAAHAIAQDIDDETGAWIHAYLHRKERDLANAGYWYRRAGRPPATGDLHAEWAEIAAEVLRDSRPEGPKAPQDPQH